MSYLYLYATVSRCAELKRSETSIDDTPRSVRTKIATDEETI